jgi:hypothetical protein
MTRTSFRALGILLVCFVVTVGCSRSGNTEAAQTVSVEDIGTNVTLIGMLGQPLGKVIAIKAHWERPLNTKDSSLQLVVLAVNDQMLEKPVYFHINQVETVKVDGKLPTPTLVSSENLEGVEWNLRAIEGGHFELDEIYEAVGVGTPGLPFYLRRFTSRLVCIIEEQSTPAARAISPN